MKSSTVQIAGFLFRPAGEEVELTGCWLRHGRSCFSPVLGIHIPPISIGPLSRILRTVKPKVIPVETVEDDLTTSPCGLYHFDGIALLGPDYPWINLRRADDDGSMPTVLRQQWGLPVAVNPTPSGAAWTALLNPDVLDAGSSGWLGLAGLLVRVIVVVGYEGNRLPDQEAVASLRDASIRSGIPYLVAYGESVLAGTLFRPSDGTTRKLNFAPGAVVGLEVL